MVTVLQAGSSELRTLPRSLVGYRPSAVEEALAGRDRQLERAKREIRELNDRIDGLEDALRELEARALAGQEALVTALTLRRLTLEQADGDAERILAEARDQATRIAEEAGAEANRRLEEANVAVGQVAAQLERLETRRAEFLDFLLQELEVADPRRRPPGGQPARPLDVRFRRRRAPT